MTEIFKRDSETGLVVSNSGRVIGIKGKEIFGGVCRQGYRQVIWHDIYGKQRYVKVHRLVARNFIENPYLLTCVNHKDENKLNNRVENLEWCNQKYNLNYGTRNMRISKSRIAHGFSIKCRLERGDAIYESDSLSEMAKKIGCSIEGIRDVVNGKRRHVFGWHLHGVTPIQYNKILSLTNGNETKTFRSIRDASRHTGCDRKSISLMIKGKQITSKGWRICQ